MKSKLVSNQINLNKINSVEVTSNTDGIIPLAKTNKDIKNIIEPILESLGENLKFKEDQPFCFKINKSEFGSLCIVTDKDGEQKVDFNPNKMGFNIAFSLTDSYLYPDYLGEFQMKLVINKINNDFEIKFPGVIIFPTEEVENVFMTIGVTKENKDDIVKYLIDNFNFTLGKW